MGRYYNGDIEGKFWFGVQSSDDADHFGVTGESNSINYYFTSDNLPDIKEGIKKCKKELGKYEKKITAFFKGEGKEGYNDKMLSKYLKVTTTKAIELITQYARLQIGKKILKCVKKNGECNFEAEI